MRIFHRWSWSFRADLGSLLSPFKFLFGFLNQHFSLNYVADRSRVVSLTSKHSNCVILWSHGVCFYPHGQFTQTCPSLSLKTANFQPVTTVVRVGVEKDIALSAVE